MCNGGGISRVSVIVHPSRQNIGRPLAKIAIVPIPQLRYGDYPFRRNAPMTVEDIFGHGRGSFGGIGPGISFQRLGSHTDAKIPLTVKSGVPGSDYTLCICNGIIGVIMRLNSSGHGGGAG